MMSLQRKMRKQGRLLLGLLLLLLLPLLCAWVSPARAASGSISTVFVIVMENENWSAIKGSADAPYINTTLLPMASYAQQDENPPGNHPSEPNYLWLEAGTNFGVQDDNPPATNHQSSPFHLTTLLDHANISWKSYQEGIDGTTCPLADTGTYVTKHNPMIFFDDVTNSNDPHSASCLAHERPFPELAQDLQTQKVAQYNFLTPNLCDDMHESCAPTSNAIRQGDTWLSQQVPTILSSQAYKNGGALFLTWDEGVGGDGPIGLIALSPFAKGHGYANTIPYTHSSLLRSIQDIFGVRPLLGDAANASDLSDLFLPGAFGGTHAPSPCSPPPTVSPSTTPRAPTNPPTASPTLTTTPTATATGTRDSQIEKDNDSTHFGGTNTSTQTAPANPGKTSASTNAPPCCPSPLMAATPTPAAPSTAVSSPPASTSALPAGTRVSTIATAYWGDDATSWSTMLTSVKQHQLAGAILIAGYSQSALAGPNHLASSIAQAHDPHSGPAIKIIGYVPTSSHDVGSIESQIDAWYQASGNLLDGIFLDESTVLGSAETPSNFSVYQQVYQHIKQERGSGTLVVLNVGSPVVWPHSDALQVGDIFMVNESTETTYQIHSPLSPPASQYGVIVENFRGNFDAFLQTAREDNIAYLYLTDTVQRYDLIPSYWNQELDALVRANSAPGSPPATTSTSHPSPSPPSGVTPPQTITPPSLTPTTPAAPTGTTLPTSTASPVTTSTPSVACSTPTAGDSPPAPSPSATDGGTTPTPIAPHNAHHPYDDFNPSALCCSLWN